MLVNFWPSLIFASKAEAHPSGARDGLLALPTNIRLGRKCLVANSLGYNTVKLITAVKSFIVQDPHFYILELFSSLLTLQ